MKKAKNTIVKPENLAINFNQLDIISIKSNCLSDAINFHMNNGDTSQTVVETAQAFYNFITKK
jgi:hypothetical protein